MIYELFSQRIRRLAKSGASDVYQYVDASPKLKVQLQQIFTDAIGPQYGPNPYGHTPPDNPGGWELIYKTLCRETGAHALAKGSTEREQVLNYLTLAEIENFLDVVELCCRYIDRVIRDQPDYRQQTLGISQAPGDAIDEINFRIRETGLGYQYENGQLIRADSDFTHQEIIKPALAVLNDSRFSGP